MFPALCLAAVPDQKKIETLPTRNNDLEPLHNVLSISTAGKNRYLLHFNSLHSLTQWTAGIRLAMFEHSSLQELYTGSLVAGKGKQLNSIRNIMEKTKFIHEDWARVRFGAGTAWQRYWCVITPPDEKEIQKHQKQLKKKSAYERSDVLKGDIKFYETKKTKKQMPIATIRDAYSAYAIYPQSKPLIEQSTLIKVEGQITIHSNPESTTEGFVFVMPEIHPAVSGFETMLRTLFPVYDIFGLYGRPSRLIADTLDSRGLMFAMPKERRYGYMDILDVAALIHTDGSHTWTEREWRKRMKECTSRRMTTNPPSRRSSKMGSQRGHTRAESLRIADGHSIRGASNEYNRSAEAVFTTPTKSQPASPGPLPAHNYHARSASDTLALSPPRRQRHENVPSRLSSEIEKGLPDEPPEPPAHLTPIPSATNPLLEDGQDLSSSDEDRRPPTAATIEASSALRPQSPPAPVTAPPAFAHQPSDRPRLAPSMSNEMRNPKRMSTGTLSQMEEVNSMRGSPVSAAAGAAAAWKTRDPGVRGAPTIEARRNPNDSRMAIYGMPYDNRTASKPRLSPVLSPAIPMDADEPPRPHSSKGITRKPLPSPPQYFPPTSPGANGGYQGQFVSSPQQTNFPRRSDSLVNHDRAGVLKTVGHSREGSDINNGDARYAKRDSGLVANDLPPIDFGPTQALRPSVTAQKPGSDDNIFKQRPRSKSPFDRLRNQEIRPPYETSKSDESVQSTARNMHWRPGVAIVGSRPSPEKHRSMTPEEFVQHRASINRKPAPIYGYTKPQSKSSPDLPLTRPSSGDWTSQIELPPRPHSRGTLLSSSQLPLNRPVSGDWTNRRELPSRPTSRGTLLASPGQDDLTSHLSAREQEYVARMTGSPLINISAGNPTPSSGGLVGAIEAREQEKKDMKHGLSSQLAQQVIAQRQRQALAQTETQQTANVAYGYPQAQPAFEDRTVVASGWSPGHSLPQTQWTSPQAAMYWGGVPPQGQYHQQQQLQRDQLTGQYYHRHSRGQQ